jgi:transcriptional regulator with XRE-family HTH domain
MATLSQYLQETGTSQKDFALLIGVDKGTISRLVAKRFNPRLPLAAKIEAATGGLVKPTDLLVDDDAEGPDAVPAPQSKQGAAG